MPELLTHTAVGFLAARGLRRGWRRIDPLLAALGACLPDWISHLFVLLPSSFAYLDLLHEPLPILLLCLLVASFFAPGTRSWAAASMVLGAYLHYLLDLFQTHAFPVYRPLFPATDTAVGFSLYSIEASVWWLPAVLLALVVDRVVARRRRRGGGTPDALC